MSALTWTVDLAPSSLELDSNIPLRFQVDQLAKCSCWAHIRLTTDSMTMDLAQIRILKLITAFFDVYQDRTVVGITLPSGWFGKPYDNYFSLESAHLDEARRTIQLELGYGWALHLVALRARLSENKTRLCVNVESGIAVSQNLNEHFGSGEVVFSVIDNPFADAALTAKGDVLEGELSSLVEDPPND